MAGAIAAFALPMESRSQGTRDAKGDSIVAAGTWTTTGSLGTGRLVHTATLLATGKVLVTGGADDFWGEGVRDSAELFDPTTGIWTPTGPLGRPRDQHTATLLADGRVLVAGGGLSEADMRSAELYDPVSGTWSDTGNMVAGRLSHAAVLLEDGRVLVSGGLRTNSAEIYDPTQGIWLPAGNLEFERQLHVMTRLDDGRVLVTGGAAFGPSDPIATEVYDPSDGMWSTNANQLGARYYHTATLLAGGKVLVAGGFGTGLELGALDSVRLLDGATGTVSDGGAMTAARVAHTANLLATGDVLVAGGDEGISAELYDTTLANWIPTGNLNSRRAYHTATVLTDGRVLVAGGIAPTTQGNITTLNLLDSAEIYTPEEPSLFQDGFE